MNKKINLQTNGLKKYLVSIVIVITLLLIDLALTGFLKFGYNVVRCGGMPVKVTYSSIGFGGGSSYDLPGNYMPGGIGNNYFCTENEVKSLHILKGF